MTTFTLKEVNGHVDNTNVPGLVEDFFFLSQALAGTAVVPGTWQLLIANQRRQQHRLMFWRVHSLRGDHVTLFSLPHNLQLRVQAQERVFFLSSEKSKWDMPYRVRKA